MAAASRPSSPSAHPRRERRDPHTTNPPTAVRARSRQSSLRPHYAGRVLRRLLALAALTALAGCGGSAAVPQVTFAAGSASIIARPTQFCDLQLQNCQSDANAPVRLRVPAGTALKVTVPSEISSTPWQVVFTYRSTNGSQTDGRSPVLTPGQHPDYTLALPTPTDALVTAQVQEYGPAPQANAETGEIEFPIRASWILNATS
jgi:hypothetical protein